RASHSRHFDARGSRPLCDAELHLRFHCGGLRGSTARAGAHRLAQLAAIRSILVALADCNGGAARRSLVLGRPRLAHRDRDARDAERHGGGHRLPDPLERGRREHVSRRTIPELDAAALAWSPFVFALSLAADFRRAKRSVERLARTPRDASRGHRELLPRRATRAPGSTLARVARSPLSGAAASTE